MMPFTSLRTRRAAAGVAVDATLVAGPPPVRADVMTYTLQGSINGVQGTPGGPRTVVQSGDLVTAIYVVDDEASVITPAGVSYPVARITVVVDRDGEVLWTTTVHADERDSLGFVDVLVVSPTFHVLGFDSEVRSKFRATAVFQPDLISAGPLKSTSLPAQLNADEWSIVILEVSIDEARDSYFQVGVDSVTVSSGADEEGPALTL